MNNWRIYLVVLGSVAALVGASVASAQDSTEAPLTFPSGNASWTVVAQYRPMPSPSVPQATPTPDRKGVHDSAPSPAPVAAEVTIRKIEVTQTGNLCRSVVTYTNGKTTEVWWIKSPPWMLFERSEHPGIMVLTNPSLMAGFRPDASLFTWVNSKSFIKDMSVQGQICGYYSQILPLEDQPPGIEIPVLHQAWLDSRTGLPVALDTTRALYLFTFNPPPTTPLTLPDRFRAELTRTEDSIPKLQYLGKARSWGSP